MGSAGKVFADSGPMHMMTKIGAASSPTAVEIDWDMEEHRRCITACLVKGTYLLESERANCWEDDANTEHLAPAWWESFHFRRHRVLACVCECLLCKIGHHILAARSTPFIYGAIFEYVPPAVAPRHPSAPSYVVAFRGTMRRDPTTLGDMRLNLRILLNEQHFCGRFSHARSKVEELLNSIPKNGGAGSSSGVWLAGHSLGASIALDVGRHIMTEYELKLPTFLFNPPQVSLASLAPAINKLPIAEVAKKGVHASSSAVKHVLGKTVLRPHRRNMEEKFERLSPWVPNLYVHPRDVICSGFIDYFEQRERHPRVAASATLMSYRDMCRSAIGKQNDRPHLLPSAVLWKNQSSQGNPHELRQWWQPQGPELELTSQLYKWS
ncbi:GDSL esterase/lipase At4g10955-like [Miscanthus floridulus]|uniref:GDSL esterase/lipase At4g10955-like n=1 Tax=Miscanthus floridulus TaxID=154761 RepID=UPI003458C57D